MLTQKYLTFWYPGAFIAEDTTIKVDEWSVDLAMGIVKEKKRRGEIIPYGFEFTTRGREEDELDAKRIAKSPFYWLGGEVQTLAQVKAIGGTENHILISNMESNHYEKIITNRNSWNWTMPLNETDIVLDFTP